MYSLKDKIRDSGISITHIAKSLGISRAGLYLKLNGATEFKASEIVKLRELMRLTAEEQEQFFFTKYSN